MSEGKYDPTCEQDPIQKKASAMTQWAADIIRMVQRDERSREAWLRKQVHFLRRRYGHEFRNTAWPWPGASDIVLPTIDMAIDRLKPMFVQSLLGTSPPITVIANKAEFHDKVPMIEQFLEWGMNIKMPRFKDEVNYGADFLLQHGIAVAEIVYDYRTRRVREVITRDSLPPDIRSVVPSDKNIDATTADAAHAISGQAVAPITPSEFRALPKEIKDNVRERLGRHFGLDLDIKEDAKSLDQLMTWLGTAESSVTIRKREVYRDSPRVSFIPIEFVVFPPYVTDPELSPRITIRRHYTRPEMIELARDQKWPSTVLDNILVSQEGDAKGGASATPTLTADELKNTRIDIHHSEPHHNYGYGRARAEKEETYEFLEHYCWEDIDGDGYPEKAVILVHPNTSQIVRAIELPYNHGQWPLVFFQLECADKRILHTRGIPEKLNDLDAEIIDQHRSKLNAMEIANAPVFTYRIGANLDPDLLRFIPGQMYPVYSHDDVKQLITQTNDVSYEREELNLLNWVERRVGILDPALTQQNQLTRPRTAREIDAIGSLQAEVSGNMLLMWLTKWAEVFRQVWALWIQYGSDEWYVQSTGDAEPVRMTRHMLQGEFDFIPSPAGLNNPAMRARLAQTQLQTLLQTLPYRQMIEPEYEFSIGTAIRDFLDLVDARRARQILRKRTPEEIQQMLQQQQQAQQQQLMGAMQGSPQEAADALLGLQEQAEPGNELTSPGIIPPGPEPV